MPSTVYPMPIRFLLTAFCLLFLSACTLGQSNTETGVVERVLDPITFELHNGERIRLIGLVSPSVNNPVECYGKEAMQAAESIVGRTIRMEKEPLLTRSQDGALTRYVFLLPQQKEEEQSVTEDAGSGAAAASADESPGVEEETQEILLNARALEMGIAFPVVSGDMVYGERMLASARYASATGKGLWNACEVTSEETPRGTAFRTQAFTECVIKGKVTQDGEKVYRTPDCPAYAETLVVRRDGGSWFCAEDTAQDAGFVKAEDCPEE